MLSVFAAKQVMLTEVKCPAFWERLFPANGCRGWRYRTWNEWCGVFNLNEHSIIPLAENCTSGNSHLSKINQILAEYSHGTETEFFLLVLTVFKEGKF